MVGRAVGHRFPEVTARAEPGRLRFGPRHDRARDRRARRAQGVRAGPRHTLALYCGASGDINPMHVDIDFAKAAGYPDVFCQWMLVMAYLGQAVTDAFPPAGLRSFTTRFAPITQLGARITCEGHVAEIVEQAGERRARISLIALDEADEVKLKGEALVAL